MTNITEMRPAVTLQAPGNPDFLFVQKDSTGRFSATVKPSAALTD
jgi:hypothetical protein